jgi:transcriptional regulator GlxA family with amidase domain
VIRNRYEQKIRIEELARIAGMSATSFHRHFRAVTAMSPLQFQKQIRLQEARRLLLSQKVDAARVSFDVGYESASQFSREYRRLFGTPPGRDAAHGRRQLLRP